MADPEAILYTELGRTVHCDENRQLGKEEP